MTNVSTPATGDPTPVNGRAPWVPLPVIELVIFDNDGVLVDSEGLSSATLAAVLRDFGVPATPAECRRDFTGGTVARVRTVIEARTGHALPVSFEAVYAERLAAAFERELAPCPGAPALLDFLDGAGIPYCVASNGSRARVEASLRATGLLGRFDGRIFSAEQVTHPKPAPDLFRRAAEVLGAPAERCLVVEDTPPGIAAGRSAGMFVWAPEGTYPAEVLGDADRVSVSVEALATELRAELAGGERGGGPTAAGPTGAGDRAGGDHPGGGAASLIETIRASVIGDDEAVAGPFGVRRVIYADYTASGRSLSFIEDYIRESVLPLYANTHSESSGTGLQTTRFREEARRIIRDAVGGTDEHAVVFCGSGSTAAVNRLVDVLNLRIPADLDDRYHLRDAIPPEERPVVLIGPYEHHSNELPWRESIAELVTVHEDHDGRIDLAQLERELRAHAGRPLVIGSFSAASNVTGIISDARAISILLHRYGALSCWDYAAAAPYVEIRMTGDGGPDGELAYKDAVFISAHKFIGGPGTPGILVARRELFHNRVPSVPGGGTVEYVNQFEHRYLADIERREEGGTPAIVESIRAGLVFQLKQAVGTGAIRERETSFIRRAIARWERNAAIEVLGSHEAERLSIVSFVVRHGGRYLHHNFVVALLNDLFGIQARGGCSCAGPYGHRLLGIDIERSREFERQVARGCEGIKPGWVRVNFNYFISETVFEYILEAVDLVATDGWRLLPLYDFDPASGLWRHSGGLAEPPLSLRDVRYDDGRMTYRAHRHREPESRLAAYLAEARAILADPPAPSRAPVPLDEGPDFEALRWFTLPQEVAAGRTA